MYFKFGSLVLFVATIICLNFECRPPYLMRQLAEGTTSTNSHPVGCETLLQGEAPIMADIVFVHGLGGHRRNTWTKDGVCWPQDLLSQEEVLSNTRVLSFGYDANIFNPTGAASLNSLFEHSINLLNELARERRQGARDRPIIFVAHSLGGLIIKDALDYSDRVSGTKPHLGQIYSATRGIVFLGTPHRGSGIASLADVVASIAQAVLRCSNVDLFQPDLYRETLTVWSFVEELAIPGIGKVDSAIIRDARENRDTIHDDHIGMAKFSSRHDTQYRKVLNAMEILLENLTDAAGKHTVPTFYDIPSFRVPHFVVRKTLLKHLRESFEHSKTTSSRIIVVLLGMGGAGKTQLALEYCRRVRDSGTHRAIFWLDASSRNALYRGFEAIARELLPERVIDHPHTAPTIVNGVLSSWTESWLMVFDGLDDPYDMDDILRFFPDSRSGSILITSRHVGSLTLGKSIELDRMEKEEAIQPLLPQGIDNEDIFAAERFLTRVEYLPLAIDLARAYITRRKLPLREFVDDFESRKKKFMQETPPFWHYRLSFFTTWEMSLSLLGVQEGHKAELTEVLTLFAFFNPQTISEMLFISDNGDAHLTTSPVSIFYNDGQWSHGKFEAAVVQMQELSLLQFSRFRGNEIVVSLHSLVSQWLHMRLAKDRRSTLLASAVWHLRNYLDSTSDDLHSRNDALSHIDNIWQIVEILNESDTTLEACLTFGSFYADQGRHEDPERMYNRVLAGYEKAWGPEHTNTLDTVHKLGSLYAYQGRLEDAEKMYNRALVGKEKAWGPEHTTTLDTVHKLGALYTNLGRLEDAERMSNRALAGYEKVWGPRHTKTLKTVNNLGILYVYQCRLEDAERMYHRTLAGYETAWGPEHEKTLNAVHNLGDLYANQGRLEDAERMYNRALAGKEKAWGPGHMKILETIHDLGVLYDNQGRLEDAERMYNRALAGMEKAWGPEHTKTLNAVNNLGNLLADLGRLEDAERMYNRALAGYEKVWGPEHTKTLNTVHNLGALYGNQGRLEGAERMYDRALAGYEMAILNTVNNLGTCYADQGRLKDAERIYNLEVGHERVLGPKHMKTLNAVLNLGVLYADLGHFEDAERAYNRVLVGYERIWGPEHTKTLDANQGRLEDAERMYRRALAGKEKVCGVECAPG